ncbi:hypothetical protein ACHAXT_012492 [Thalassiosira profunda]
MAFGKLKKLIKKTPGAKAKGHVALDDDVASAPSAEGRGDLPDGDVESTPRVTNLSEGLPPAPSGSQTIHTEADDVLDGILQDLNIKVGQLAVDAMEKSDTVSEYSGGSAQSVESGGSESGSDDDEEDEEKDEEEDDEEEVVHKLASPTSNDGSPDKKTKKKKTVRDRVEEVVKVADEIKAKRDRRTPSPATPLTEPGSQAEEKTTVDGEAPAMPIVDGEAPVLPSPGTSKQQRPPSPDVSKQESKTSKASKQESKKSKGSKRKDKKVRSSPPPEEQGEEVEAPLPAPKSELPPPVPKKAAKKSLKSPFGKKKARASTPELIARAEQQLAPEGPAPSQSFDEHTRDDTLTDMLSEEEGTFDESLDENTLETNSGSLEEDATVDEEERGAEYGKAVMNKDIMIHRPGGPSALVVRAMYYTPLPASPDDIVIKVEASTVTFRDCLLRRGIGTDKASFPFIPGCEVVGTISNIGKEAKREGYRVGDRVVGLTRSGGGNGYYAKLPMRCVAPVLATGIDAADAVCLVDVYMTAYQALRVGKKDGTPLTESNVLVTDGFSPVGQACVALAKLEGANVYVTTTDPGRQDEHMKGMGAKTLPPAPSKWLPKIKGKMDVVIDNTCLDSYDSSWKALNPNGVLVCTGLTSIYSFQDYTAGGCGGCEAFGDVRDYQARWARVKAKYMMSQTKFHDLWDSFQNDPKRYQQELKYLCHLVESGALKPKISERVSIEEVPDAQRYLETGKANGTVVCLP